MTVEVATMVQDPTLSSAPVVEEESEIQQDEGSAAPMASLEKTLEAQAASSADNGTTHPLENSWTL